MLHFLKASYALLNTIRNYHAFVTEYGHEQIAAFAGFL